MKKLNFYKKKSLKMLSLVLMATAFSEAANAQISVTNLNQPVNFGRMSVFDIDGDGDLDLVVGGATGSGDRVQVYLNDGNGVFTPMASPLDALVRPTYDWNDINQDGKPDFILNGFSGPSRAKIYTTDGNGNFTLSPIALPQIAPTSGFADLNNDGYLDIFVFGNGTNSKILFNNAGNGYIEYNLFSNYNFIDPEVSVIDYDNDKDLDLFITAIVNNQRFSRLFINNNGVFTETTITNLVQRGNGSNTWGDFDGDGLPDLLVGGDSFVPGNFDMYQCYYTLYKNNGDGTFTHVENFTYRQNFTTGGGRFLDWDNDGDLDIVVTGWNWGEGRQATDIYINNGGVFTAYAGNTSIPGSSEGAIELGDVDNDGDIDLFVTGYSGNNWNGAGGFNSHAAFIIVNQMNNLNTVPTAPTNLVVTGSSSQLNFSWNASTDATTPQASLTYNFFLVDGNNKWYYYPLSDIATGKTKAARIGNVQYNTGWIVKNLPQGDYRWGVQAVDNSYAGSTFAEGTFSISPTGTLPVKLTDYNAAIEGRNAVVKWKSLTEVNVDKYIVERSTDGKTFTVIASIPAAGNSNVVKDYNAKDTNPASGKNYYRLTSIDKDSKQEVFDVLILDFKISGDLVSVYPNPVTTSEIGVQITGHQGKVTVKVIDMLGKTLKTSTVDTNSGNGYYKISLDQKPSSGLYNVNISGKAFNQTIKVLVK